MNEMPPTLARICMHCSELPPAEGVLSAQLVSLTKAAMLMLEQLHPSNA